MITGPGPLKKMVVAQGSLSFTNITFNEVWEKCEKTLIGWAYRFYTADKASGLIQARRAGYAADYYYWTILIFEKDGKVALTCKVSIEQLGEVIPLRNQKEGERELDRLFAALKKSLKKS